jgi:hypothetical protein
MSQAVQAFAEHHLSEFFSKFLTLCPGVNHPRLVAKHKTLDK